MQRPRYTWGKVKILMPKIYASSIALESRMAMGRKVDLWKLIDRPAVSSKSFRTF